MSIQQFESELRTHMHREPYVPFLVVLKDGRTILIDKPTIAFDGGRAGFIGPEEIEMFDSDEVKEFRLAQGEPAA